MAGPAETTPGRFHPEDGTRPLVGDDPLQGRVLAPQLAQLLGVGRLHPAVLVSPAVQGVLGDLERLRDLRGRAALGQHPLGLAQLADDLLGDVASSLHLIGPPSPIVAGG